MKKMFSLVLAAFLLGGCVQYKDGKPVETASSEGKPKEEVKKEEPKKEEKPATEDKVEEVKLPTNEEELTTYLENALPKEAKGGVVVTTLESGSLSASVNFQLEDGFVLDTAGKNAARDFIFAAYASGMDIGYALATVMAPDGTLGLSAGVGKEAAATQDPSAWTDSSVGATVFIDWVKDNLNETEDFTQRVILRGQWVE
jgi:hypothetical protein